MFDPKKNSRFTPATNLKIGTYVLILNFVTQKGISKKLQSIRKGPFQIIDKPIHETFKLDDSNEKKLFNIETIFYPITQKNTLFAS